MSIALLKKIEDNRQVLSNLNKQFEAKINDTIHSETNMACSDFKRFFDNQGFEVKETPADFSNTLVAKYGTVKITLTYNYKSNFTGVLAVLCLIVQTNGNEKYRILLQRKNASRIRPTIHTLSFNDDNDEKKQQNEIIDIKKQTECTKTKIDNLGHEEWIYSLTDEKDKECGTFTSMSEILKFIVK